MKNQLLVTAVGADRPGIVARLSELFVKHKGNMEESRMAILGGEFAAIILVSIPDQNVGALKAEMDALTGEGISITVKSTKPLYPERFADQIQCEISLRGADHEGIVYEVSRLLSERSINIQRMDTIVLPSPETAGLLFYMQATVYVPASTRIDELQNHLDEIAKKEKVEIVVSESQWM